MTSTPLFAGVGFGVEENVAPVEGNGMSVPFSNSGWSKEVRHTRTKSTIIQNNRALTDALQYACKAVSARFAWVTSPLQVCRKHPARKVFCWIEQLRIR